MDDNNWTISDWLIIFFPCIWVIVSMLLGWREYMDTIVIFGYEVSVVVIAALIAALASITGIFLKHLFIDRRQYKEILKRLGKFDDVTLEKLIKSGLGTNKDTRSLTGQLGIGKNDMTITGQIGIGKEDKSLTGQHRDILFLVKNIDTFLSDEKEKQKKLHKAFNKSSDEIKNTLASLIKDWEETKLNNIHLKDTVNRQINTIKELKKYIRMFENTSTTDLYSQENEDEDEFEH